MLEVFVNLYDRSLSRGVGEKIGNISTNIWKYLETCLIGSLSRGVGEDCARLPSPKTEISGFLWNIQIFKFKHSNSNIQTQLFKYCARLPSP